MPGSSLCRYSPVPGYSVAAFCVTRYCSGESLEMASRSFRYFCISFSSVGGRRMTRTSGRHPPHGRLTTQRLEAGAHFLREELRLLPGSEVAALGKLAVVDEVRIGLLRPTPRRLIELV